MSNVKYDTNENTLVVAMGEEGGIRKDLEFGISRGKLL